MLDSHCHLVPPHFSLEQIPIIISKSKENGINHIINVSETYEQCLQVLDLSRNHPTLLPALGLHPCSINENHKQETQKITDLIHTHSSEIKAIGEIGLDFSPHIIGKKDSLEYNKSKTIQIEIFKHFIDLAMKYDLPMTIHSRNAGHYVIDIIKQYGSRKCILHCFDGKVSFALQALEFGCYFSIPPCVIRSEGLRKLVKCIPLSHLLLESDSPSLGPIINEVNEPYNCIITVNEIAKIKNISPDLVIETINSNALDLFRIQ